MAANTNKRIAIKHVRDGAKARYPKRETCAICGTTEELELHHFTGLTNLLLLWQKKTGITLDTDEQVLEIRERFIAEHEYELYVAVVVLCADHHTKLHKVYGKSPALNTAKKQESWVLKQKEKYSNGFQPTKLDNEAQSGTSNDCKKRGFFGSIGSGSDYLASFRPAGVGEPGD